MILFDTHAHYDDEAFDTDREEVLSSLAASNVGLVLNPGADLASSRRANKLAQSHDFMYCAAGVHPHSAKEFNEHQREEIYTLLSQPKTLALGEIGLDYHYDLSERTVQKSCFAAQLSMARELDIPVIIHEREAAQDCLEIIKNSGVTRGVYHCYSGSLETAKELIRMGFYLSFTGVITFKNARRAPEVIEGIPQDRIMVETDSPYLAPEPCRGKRNDSRLLTHIAQRVADIRNISLEKVAEITTQNGKAFFGIE